VIRGAGVEEEQEEQEEEEQEEETPAWKRAVRRQLYTRVCTTEKGII